tara:strand:+ start:129 stop:350 length:222 start_codon:yes stop_codon:yes gene_type:complete
MSNEQEQNRWRVVPESEPNFEGTDIGKMLEGLKNIQAHYEGELQKDLETLSVLQQGIAKWELQKKKRKVDPNG